MNDQIYEIRKMQMQTAAWPLGMPAGADGPPLWHRILQDWTYGVMRPSTVTALVEVVMESENAVQDDIRKAIQDTADWQGACEAHKWMSSYNVMEKLAVPSVPLGLTAEDEETWRLFEKKMHAVRERAVMSLALLAIEGASAIDPENTDTLYCWKESYSYWEGNELVTEDRDIHWHCLFPGSAVEMPAPPVLPEGCRHSGEAPLLHLERAAADNHGSNTMGAICRFCYPAVKQWLCREWLSGCNFVNLEQDEWSSCQDWRTLAEHCGIVAGNDVEVAGWYMIEAEVGEHIKALGGIVCDMPDSSDVLYGRKSGGEALHLDGEVAAAMIRSGYLEHLPPLGALDFTKLVNIDVTLGGDDYPMAITGFRDQRTDEELSAIMLLPEYREAGWIVEWGVARETAGTSRRPFRVVPPPLPAEKHPDSTGEVVSS